MPEMIFAVPAAGAGQRLDKALSLAFPGMGVRGCRRFWERGQVLVNGRARPRGWSVAEDDVVTVRLPEAPGSPAWRADAGGGAEDAPRLLAERGDLAFLYKPAGLHSAALAGSAAPSLEGLLPRLLGQEEGRSVLLNRLDQGTSGVVAAARTPEGRAWWRRAEDAGQCEKRYLAVLEGRLAAPLTVSRALDTARRATSVTLPEEGEPLRRTCLEPLGELEENGASRLFPGESGPLTLAGCLIHKGARHQIRAHAAHAGHPLAGDARYGARREGRFLLHHGALLLDGIPLAACAPVWLERLPATLRAVAAVWLGLEEDSDWRV